MQDQYVRKIPVGVSCSRLGEEDDPCAGRTTLISRVSKRKQLVLLGMRFVDARADMLDGFEKQVGS
jgi:hypothetical protein